MTTLEALIEAHVIEPYVPPVTRCPKCKQRRPRPYYKPFQLSDAHGEWYVLRCGCGHHFKEPALRWDDLPKRPRPS